MKASDRKRGRGQIAAEGAKSDVGLAHQTGQLSRTQSNLCTGKVRVRCSSLVHGGPSGFARPSQDSIRVAHGEPRGLRSESGAGIDREHVTCAPLQHPQGWRQLARPPRRQLMSHQKGTAHTSWLTVANLHVHRGGSTHKSRARCCTRTRARHQLALRRRRAVIRLSFR